MPFLTAGLFAASGRPTRPADRHERSGRPRQERDRTTDHRVLNDMPRPPSFASPEIKSVFPNAERFFEMVKKSYGPVYRPAIMPSVVIRFLRWHGCLSGGSDLAPDGKDWAVYYELKRQRDGQFAINGVRMNARERTARASDRKDRAHSRPALGFLASDRVDIAAVPHFDGSALKSSKRSSAIALSDALHQLLIVAEVVPREQHAAERFVGAHE